MVWHELFLHASIMIILFVMWPYLNQWSSTNNYGKIHSTSTGNIYYII